MAKTVTKGAKMAGMDSKKFYSKPVAKKAVKKMAPKKAVKKARR